MFVGIARLYFCPKAILCRAIPDKILQFPFCIFSKRKCLLAPPGGVAIRTYWHPQGVSIRTYWHPLGGVDKNLLAPPKNYHVNAGVGAFQLILEYQMVSVGGQILTKDKRPPSLCRQCTAVVFLGLTNTCCNRNGWGCTPSTPQKLHQVHPQEVAPQKLHPGVKARGAGGGEGGAPPLHLDSKVAPRYKS